MHKTESVSNRRGEEEEGCWGEEGAHIFPLYAVVGGESKGGERTHGAPVFP